MTTTLLLLSCLLSASLVHAYTYDVQIGTFVLQDQSTGRPAVWAQTPIAIASRLGAPYDVVVMQATAVWNGVVPLFTGESDSPPVVIRWGEPGEVRETSAATTKKLIRGGVILRAEVLLNPMTCWDAYPGPIRMTTCAGVWTSVSDVARVVLHELGHVVGLEHPDKGGQTVVALMNSVESDLETLTADDAAGIRALYDPALRSAAQAPRMANTGGGGGCAIQAGSEMDLGALVLLALFYVWHGWKKLRP